MVHPKMHANNRKLQIMENIWITVETNMNKQSDYCKSLFLINEHTKYSKNIGISFWLPASTYFYLNVSWLFIRFLEFFMDLIIAFLINYELLYPCPLQHFLVYYPHITKLITLNCMKVCCNDSTPASVIPWNGGSTYPAGICSIRLAMVRQLLCSASPTSR